jgi:putative sigma-54 modulation protein
MQVTVKGRHMTITDSLRDYAEEKFGRVSKVYDTDPSVAEVVLHVEKNKSNPARHVAEVTLRLKGHVVRAEEASDDMHAAIDLAADKVERQMRKYKTKVIDKRNRAEVSVKTAAGDMELAEVAIPEPEVVKVKTLDVKPMSEEEAILQLELLGHDFFVFRHADSELVNVLYRRNDGDFGLIQPSA